MDHHWSPHWKTSLYGGYGEISYSGAANLWMWGNGFSGDFNYAQIGSRTVWSPVKHLDLSVDVMYQNLNTAETGASPCPFNAAAGHRVCNDQSNWGAILRAQYNFFP